MTIPREARALLPVLAAILLLPIGCSRTKPAPQPVAQPAEKPPAEKPAVALMIEPTEIALGEVSVKTRKRFTASIVNLGKEAFEIVGIDSTCGCTAISVSRPTCKPGEKVEAVGEFRAGNQAGSFRKTITVRCKNASGTVRMACALVGTIVQEVPVEPSTITLSPSCLKKTPDQAVVVVRNRSQQVILLAQPVGLPKGVEATLDKKELAPGEKATITVRAKPVFLVDSNIDMRVATSHPIEDQTAVSVLVRPKDGI